MADADVTLWKIVSLFLLVRRFVVRTRIAMSPLPISWALTETDLSEFFFSNFTESPESLNPCPSMIFLKEFMMEVSIIAFVMYPAFRCIAPVDRESNGCICYHYSSEVPVIVQMQPLLYFLLTSEGMRSRKPPTTSEHRWGGSFPESSS